MSNEKPWVVTDAELAEFQALADDWWKKATPADRRRLWDYIQVEYADRVLDVTTDLAELAFFAMVRRFPALEVQGDSP